MRIVVVGNGLIGSAAARHLGGSGHDVTVVGPAEPADPTTHDGVFASHYDEGRLLSVVGPNPTWSALTACSVEAFAGLEEQTGIRFHEPVGRLSAVAPERASRAAAWVERADPSGVTLSWCAPGDPGRLAGVPALALPDDVGVVRERAPAGYVNPRAMLRAQNVAAARDGARLIDATVTGVASGSSQVAVSLDDGTTVGADRVLIACGAFSNLGELLPAPIPLRLKTETTVRATLPDDLAASLAGLPVVTYDIDDPDVDDVYLAPPIRYPDGRFRVKMGCNTPNETWPTTAAEVKDWFRTGLSDRDLVPMERVLRTLLPGVPFGDVTTHRCIVAYTPSGYPTIDRAPGDAHGRIFVAAGGNGTSAQCADALGRLAALVVTDAPWWDDVPRHLFEVSDGWQRDTGRDSKALRRARALGADGVGRAQADTA